MTNVLESLNIRAEMVHKTKLIRDAPAFKTLFEHLKSGDIELGIEQISLIVAAPDVQLAGPLPKELQSYTRYAIGLVSNSAEREAANTFIHFLSSSQSKTVLRAKGFDVD